MVQDPYKILGLTESASADEVKRAYKKKVKECHPDLHPNDPTAHESWFMTLAAEPLTYP